MHRDRFAPPQQLVRQLKCNQRSHAVAEEGKRGNKMLCQSISEHRHKASDLRDRGLEKAPLPARQLHRAYIDGGWQNFCEFTVYGGTTACMRKAEEANGSSSARRSVREPEIRRLIHGHASQ